jgi:hypothetical protein
VSQTPPPSGVLVVDAYVSFYGAYDNCPPGGAIAFPGFHGEAGGNGSFADPYTYAGAPAKTPPGTRIYVPFVQKYFIMEDYCQECVQDTGFHFDLWMGPVEIVHPQNLIACEVAYTQQSATVYINPPANLPVDDIPLFDQDGNCKIDAPPCVDEGNICGNLCELPMTDTCDGLAVLFDMPLSRFLELNPGVNCTATVQSGTTVCMGGTCGG